MYFSLVEKYQKKRTFPGSVWCLLEYLGEKECPLPLPFAEYCCAILASPPRNGGWDFVGINPLEGKYRGKVS
jgi:hypothetical protein